MIMIFHFKRTVLFENRINWPAVVLMLALMQGLLLYGHAGTACAAAASGNWTDAAYVATGFASGTGTSSNPYIISTPGQLAYLAKKVNSGYDYSGSYFKLSRNLDLSAHYWTPIGGAYYMGSPCQFQGNFNGNGHRVSGVTINAGGSNYCGLFGCTGRSSSISNLGVKDAAITGGSFAGALIGYTRGAVSYCYADGSVSGADNVGALIGYTTGAVSHCYASGSATGSSNVGGLIGQSGAIISYSWAGTSVTGTSNYTGGLVGYATIGDFSVAVKNCFAMGQVSGSGQYTGGLIGYTFCGVSDCYASGNVSGTKYTGGFTGYLDNPCTISHCYASGDVSSSGDNAGGFIGFISAHNRIVKNSFCTGAVTSYTGTAGYVGSFAGCLGGSGSAVLTCYYKDNSYPGPLSYGIGTMAAGNAGADCSRQSTASFYNTSSTYTTPGNWTDVWDMTGTWTINSGAGYPTLLNMPEARGADAAAKTLTVDSSDNDLDHNIEITFAADSTFENDINEVSFNGAALTAGTDYSVSSGILTLIPGSAIKTPATGDVVIIADYYNDSNVSQTVYAGCAASLTVTTQPSPGAGSGDAFATQPIVALADRYGNTCSSGASAAAGVTASAKVGSGSWTIGGTTVQNAVYGVATFTDLTCTPVISGEGYITFSTGTGASAPTVNSNAFTILGGAASGDATLNSLILSTGTMSPAFNAATTGYAVSVANSVESLTVTPTVTESHATVEVNDTVVNSGSPSGAINLNVGENTITIVVTAQDNTAKTYTVTVTRAAAGAITLTAAAGNRFVNLSWSPVADAVNYAVYQSVTAGSYGDALATVTGTVYEVRGLTNGTPYYFMVKGLLSGGGGISSNEVQATPHKNSSDDSSSPGGNESPGNTATPATGGNTVSIQVNGVDQSLATATTAIVNNRTVTTVVVNDSQVNEKLASEGNNAVITIPITNSADVAIGQLNGQTVKNMEDKQAVLQIKTEQATYTLPAQQIYINAVSAQIGKEVKLSDITVSIEIAKASEQTVKVVENAASQGNFSIMVPPVDFTVTCTYGDKTVNVSQFNSYVERTIAIPEGVDPNKITTGVVVDPDGTTRHVPTQIVKIDGKYYAKINSLTNSTYSVIWNPLEFKDVANHWAKAAVNDMGSRMVISGVSKEAFEPDRDITRAEFAAVIVRALGLKPGIGSSRFSDVSDKDWYCDYVKTALEYKIISGYGNGLFGPNDQVTREQAFAMTARAMNITGLKAEFAAGEADKLMAKFSDANQASSYAKDSIAACVKTTVISGRNGNLLNPKDNITRAEAAVIVQKLLQKANLI